MIEDNRSADDDFKRFVTGEHDADREVRGDKTKLVLAGATTDMYARKVSSLTTFPVPALTRFPTHSAPSCLYHPPSGAAVAACSAPGTRAWRRAGGSADLAHGDGNEVQLPTSGVPARVRGGTPRSSVFPSLARTLQPGVTSRCPSGPCRLRGRSRARGSRGHGTGASNRSECARRPCEDRERRVRRPGAEPRERAVGEILERKPVPAGELRER